MSELSSAAAPDLRVGPEAAAPAAAHEDGLVDPAGVRIAVVDDEPANVGLLRRILEPVGYEEIASTTDPRRAVSLCREADPDLVILDLRMPYLDGFEVYEELDASLPGFAFVPVLFLTADDSRQAQERALSIGGQDYLTKPFSPREVRIRVRNLLTTRALHLALQEANRELDARVRKRTEELNEARIEILERLALAAEYRDDQTGKHTQRVGRLAAGAARGLDLDGEVVERLRRAAPLHDVGKIGIHDSILLKPGELTPEEFSVMETHTLIGADILSGSRFPVLRMAEEIARYHHERWDGSGYPEGLEGDEIPLSARIVAVADVFDSLTHDRVYKDAWTEEEAVEHLREGRDELFDPRVVDAFLAWNSLSPGGEEDPGAEAST